MGDLRVENVYSACKMFAGLRQFYKISDLFTLKRLISWGNQLRYQIPLKCPAFREFSIINFLLTEKSYQWKFN